MRFLWLGFLALAAPASAEVLQASSNGFEVQQTVQLVAPPRQAWAALGRIGGWWDPEHTYSGKSANMSLELRPGGCFCERVPAEGGGIEHMRVAYVVPGKRLVMTGGLGPLLYEATSTVMDIQIAPSGAGSKLTLNYRAAGFHKGGADQLAAPVDGVLAEQMKRLRAFVARGGGR